MLTQCLENLKGSSWQTLVVTTLLDVVVIKEEVYNDSKLKWIIEKLLEDEDSVSNYSLEHGALKLKGRLVISKNSTLLPSIILHTTTLCLEDIESLTHLQKITEGVILGRYEGCY